MKFIILFFTFLICKCSLADPQEELMEDELDAFRICNMDDTAGLTWEEVKTCEEEYAEMLAGQNVPSEEDFQNADLNGDGTLMFEEWLEWVMEGEEEDADEGSDEE